jgi:cell division protein FtsQ
MEVQSRSPEVAQGVAAALQVSFPVSSFDLDLPALRATAEDFEAIEQAWLQVRPGGVLEVRLQERLPAMVWRHAGGLDLIDATGHRVAQLASREARADLPLIAGEGAPEAVAEALLLWAAATPLQSRIRGLVRMGERRWDLVLDRNQRILLPEDGALGALERVLALDATQGLLSRDLSIVDLRIPSRPVLRLSAEALADLHRNRSSLQGAVTQ